MGGIAGGVNRALQRRADGGPRRLTAERRKLFLDELGATCNATRSARVAGACVDAFYRCRQRDEAFAAAWEAAMATGYARLEAELLAAALGEKAGSGEAGSETPPAIDRALALSLLGRRDAKARSGNPGGFGRVSRARHIPMADVEAALLRQLVLLEKRLGKRA
ncbi:hypothetical protein [uncultured Sphingomonas sp.]|uniref:hypothetical protein n=1 Tax=uncultured Sphingomonas sp. TaxID=158754 RepID=UPI0035C9F92D